MIKELEKALDNMLYAFSAREIVNMFGITYYDDVQDAANNFINEWDAYNIYDKLRLCQGNLNIDFNNELCMLLTNWSGNLDTYNQYELDKLTPDTYFDAMTVKQRLDLLINYIQKHGK